MRRLIIAFAALGLTACASLTAAQPARDVVDPARLMADTRHLADDAMEGRGAGTPGGARAREYVVERFEQEGVEPFPGGFARPFLAPQRPPGQGVLPGVNVVGLVRGTERPDRYILVTAHYDHEGVKDGQIYNGADDNAAGVAALFELARLLRERPPRHSVILAALDAEELGLVGARALAEDPPVPLEAVSLNLNLDMIARLSDGVLWAAGPRYYPFLRPYLEQAAVGAPITLRFGHDDPGDPAQDWIPRSDQAPFHARGVPVVFFSVDDHADYHRPSDDADRIDVDDYTAAVALIARSLRLFDAELEALDAAAGR